MITKIFQDRWRVIETNIYRAVSFAIAIFSSFSYTENPSAVLFVIFIFSGSSMILWHDRFEITTHKILLCKQSMFGLRLRKSLISTDDISEVRVVEERQAIEFVLKNGKEYYPKTIVDVNVLMEVKNAIIDQQRKLNRYKSERRN